MSLNLNLNKKDNEIAEEMGFSKSTKKRKSAVELGAKHTAKTIITRSIKDTIGNGLVGSIIALVARDFINKKTK